MRHARTRCPRYPRAAAAPAPRRLTTRQALRPGRRYERSPPRRPGPHSRPRRGLRDPPRSSSCDEPHRPADKQVAHTVRTWAELRPKF